MPGSRGGLPFQGRLPLADRCSGCLAAQETFAAIYRTSLGGFERHRGFTAALRAGGHGFAFGETAAAGCALALGHARFAALGLVPEVLVVEEVLLSRCEYKICSA